MHVGDPHLGREHLCLLRPGVDPFHSVHPRDHLAEGGEALAVPVTRPAAVKFRLIAACDTQLRARLARCVAGTRSRPARRATPWLVGLPGFVTLRRLRVPQSR